MVGGYRGGVHEDVDGGDREPEADGTVGMVGGGATVPERELTRPGQGAERRV